MKRICFALGALIMLVGCTSQPPAQPSNLPTPKTVLDGTSWMMVIPKDSSCEVPPMMEFDGHNASGDMGCNRFETTYTIQGDRMRFNTYSATTRNCAKEFMDLEKQMRAVLDNTARFARTAKSLTFFDEQGKKILELVPEQAGACE